MSLQIFLHGKILGTEEFLRSAGDDFEARAQWSTLISEVLPRALLAELRLSAVLLGASGGGEFLLLLPEEAQPVAAAFCNAAADALAERTGGAIRLIHAFTENLGDWSDVRKRLLTELHLRSGTPASAAGNQLFDMAVEAAELRPFEQLFESGGTVGWSPDAPGEIRTDESKHTWKLGEDIPFPSHVAPNDEGSGRADSETLASRASGRWLWGMLRGAVDDLGARLGRAANVPEYLQLSTLYKQFFAGELQMRCSLPEYWRKVTLLHADGHEFAVAGAWDSLIALARDLQRLFAIHAESNLHEFAGPEGKTISMAIVLASGTDDTLASMYATAGDRLQTARASGRDSVDVFGRTLEWKQLADAAESHVTMTRLIRDFGVPRQFLDEISAFYGSVSDTIVTPGARRANARVDRPWRFYRRLNTLLSPTGRPKEFQKLRSDLISDFTGQRASQIRLRPQGRVALEWARLETE